MMKKQNLIDQIENKYTPDFDIPAEPQVTWVDAYLLEIIKVQQEQIEKLEEEVNRIKKLVRDKDRRLIS